MQSQINMVLVIDIFIVFVITAAVLDRTTRNSTVYDRLKDEDGAALYVIAIISLFATAIVLFIGMMSFKKKKYDEWDRQGRSRPIPDKSC